jgi:hypothetical protein
VNKKVKSLWVSALRSGKYKRCTAQLKKDDGFCCLGVLCDLHARRFKNTWDGEQYLSEDSELPEDVIEWAGLSAADPQLNPSREVDFSTATHYNDKARYSFNKIADLIEKNL